MCRFVTINWEESSDVSSKVHLRRSLRVVDWFNSGPMRGLGWVDNEMRWVKVFSWNTFLTCAICRSWWRVWFEIFCGAWVMRRRSLDWCLWRTDILVVEAQPTVQCRRSIPALESLCRRAPCWSVTTGNVSLWSSTIPWSWGRGASLLLQYGASKWVAYPDEARDIWFSPLEE